MKRLFGFVILFLWGCSSPCDSIAKTELKTKKPHKSLFAKEQRRSPYAPKFITTSFSVGILDGYRANYTLPSGYEKGTTTGFMPILGKIEYGVSKKISLGGAFSYDVIFFNFYHTFTGNGLSFKRYGSDKQKIFAGGLFASYHLGEYINIKRLDPFVNVGLMLNNINYSAYPQGDSIVTRRNHTVTPFIKVGARYQLNNNACLFFDAGYDKQCIFSIGVSCRINKK